MRDFVDGCDVCFELWEEAPGEVSFESVILELVYLLVVELFGVDGGCGIDGVIFSQSDE